MTEFSNLKCKLVFFHLLDSNTVFSSHHTNLQNWGEKKSKLDKKITDFGKLTTFVLYGMLVSYDIYYICRVK